MTIKKIAFSAIAAASLSTAALATTTYNGTLSVSGGINTISEELISATDVNVSFTNGILYQNGMEASSATEPGFELKFTNATFIGNSGQNLVVKVAAGQGYDDENLTIATFDRLDGASVIFSTVADSTVERTKKYEIVTDDNSVDNNTTYSHVAGIAASDLNVTITKGAPNTTAELILYSNSGDSTLDKASKQILEQKTQFSGSFGKKLDASIDASNDFLKFDRTATNAGAASFTTDTLSFTFSNDKDITYPATVSKVDVNVTAVDANISAVNSVANSNSVSDTISGAWLDGDFNGTRLGNNTLYFEASTGNQDNNGSITAQEVVTVDGSTKINETTFNATSTVTFNSGFTKSLYGTSPANAGKWDIYGYNAKIPGASFSSNAGTDTIVTIVNTQTKGSNPVNAYFTLIDQDGNECTIDSTMGYNSVDIVKPGAKNKYRLSDMLNDCATIGAAVSGTAYGIEFNVPTTPSDIYTNAFVQNTKASNGRFKVLPVYNNGTTY